jgi:hypothetical protein
VIQRVLVSLGYRPFDKQLDFLHEFSGRHVFHRNTSREAAIRIGHGDTIDLSCWTVAAAMPIFVGLMNLPRREVVDAALCETLSIDLCYLGIITFSGQRTAWLFTSGGGDIVSIDDQCLQVGINKGYERLITVLSSKDPSTAGIDALMPDEYIDIISTRKETARALYQLL